ncbi:MAG: hypothetical protein NVS2B12_21800 [Ktedonobacteraceae bacterium]
MNSAMAGLIAGAAGTVALNIATYADMALRGRPSSSAPSQMVGILADKAGLQLSPQGNHSDDQTTQNRESGLGALLGLVNGLGMGFIYSVLRPQLDGISIPAAALGVGAAAMAASDIPLVTLKVSDPKTWGVSGWAADAIPHIIYGLVTVLVYEALLDEDAVEG